MIFDKMASERVRVHHPPDFIIKGKPKWTDIMMTEQLGQTGSSGPEERHVVERLNSSRNMISSIESQYGESAENSQKQFKVGLLSHRVFYYREMLSSLFSLQCSCLIIFPRNC